MRWIIFFKLQIWIFCTRISLARLLAWLHQRIKDQRLLWQSHKLRRAVFKNVLQLSLQLLNFLILIDQEAVHRLRHLPVHVFDVFLWQNERVASFVVTVGFKRLFDLCFYLPILLPHLLVKDDHLAVEPLHDPLQIDGAWLALCRRSAIDALWARVADLAAIVTVVAGARSPANTATVLKHKLVAQERHRLQQFVVDVILTLQELPKLQLFAGYFIDSLCQSADLLRMLLK